MPIQTVSQAFTNEGVGGFSFRNKIINGDMRIAQRTAGAVTSVASSRGAGFALDRWSVWLANWVGGAATQQQSTDVPSGQGFVNSLLVTVTGASSSPDPTSGRFLIHQMIEGFNVADLNWGKQNAKSVTVSFWVKSSVTGNYGFTLTNADGNRGYVVSYAINAANTWEQKIVTIPGDTSGTWTTDNTAGVTLNFDLGVNGPTTDTVNTWLTGDYRGLTSGVDLIRTNGATFYLTGVQFEVGSVATEFERRPYGLELSLCQRYLPSYIYESSSGSEMIGWARGGSSSTIGSTQIVFPVTARVPPTGISVTGSSYAVSGLAFTTIAFGSASTRVGQLDISGGSGMTALAMYTFTSSAVGSKILFTGCEL
jgi:hypothetical protein